MRKSRLAAYRIKQDGMIVARVEGENNTQAFKEIVHYARQYAQDGPLQIQYRNRDTGRWLVYDNWDHLTKRTGDKDA